MNITPISANNSLSVKGWSNIKRSDLYKKNVEKEQKKISELPEVIIPATTAMLLSLNDMLKDIGITHYKKQGDKLNMHAGYNGGFYSVSVPKDMKEVDSIVYLVNSIDTRYDSFGGLYNYIRCVKDLKRQDIVQKGLQIHTYEINRNVDNDQKEDITDIFQRILDKDIYQEDLFFIDEDAFYYDKYAKTAYSLNTYVADYKKQPSKKIRKCEFITDKAGNTIGYKITAWDHFARSEKVTEYIEQQAPSEELPAIVNSDNNKRLAEAFRFGNAEMTSYRGKIAIEEKILPHLKNKVGIKDISKDKLNITKYYDNKGEVQTRISYYDPTIGHSLVYNIDGSYMYQMEYVKDPEGNIIAASRL